MNTPLVKIIQSDKDIGWGKLGALEPAGEKETEITLHDVRIIDSISFEISGPFRLEIEDKSYDQCRPVNFRALRPGSDYERVIFRTDKKPRIK